MPQVLCPEFVGRDAELATLRRTLDAAQAGSGGLTFVVGMPGVGKSRLAREVAAEARRRGMAVLAGRAVESGSPLPFRPLTEALLASFRSSPLPTAPELVPFRGALARLVPDWHAWRVADQDPIGPAESPVVLAEGLLRLLGVIGGHRGGVLVLEDLHWADVETLTVLEYLADNLGETPLVCLATLRPETSAGYSMVHRLLARRAADLVELGRLTDEAAQQMLSACLAVAPGLSEQVGIEDLVLERAEGVPLLVEDLLAAASESPPHALESLVPLTFADAISRRMLALEPEVRQVVQVAAVLGRAFDWRLLGGVNGLDDDRVSRALRTAVEAQLVVGDGSSTTERGYRFRHALTREAILADLLPHERATLARQALVSLQTAFPELPGAACELAADLSEMAGDRSAAAAWLLEAGRRSLARGALATAEQTLQRALELATQPLSPHVEHALLETLALAGKADEAFGVGERLLLRPEAELGATTRSAIYLRLARAAAAATRWPEADEYLRRASDATSVSAGTSAARDALAAQIAIGEGRADAAMCLARQALSQAEQLDLPQIACEALEVIGRCERVFDLDRAEAAFERGRATAQRAGLRLWEIRALHELGTVSMLRDLRVERLVEARALAHDAGALVTAATVDLQIASTRLYRFEPRDGLESVKRCEDAARRLHIDSLLPSAALTRAACHALMREREAMDAAIEQATTLAPGDREISGAALLTARGLLSLIEEHRAQALAEMDEGVRLLREVTALPYPMRSIWALLCTLESRSDEVARSEIHAGGITVLPINRAILDYAQAVALGRDGDRNAAEQTFAAAEALLSVRPGTRGMRCIAVRLVGEAALADGWGDPIRWLSDAAEYFNANGFGQLALACRGLLRKHGVAVPRRGRGDAEVPPPLRHLGVTSREVDVLILVRERLSDRQIGEKLVVSPRTVEKHVERLMRKTGLQSRADLAALANRILPLA